MTTTTRTVTISYPTHVHVTADELGHVVKITILPDAGSPGGAPAFVWDTAGFDLGDETDAAKVWEIVTKVDESWEG